MTTFLIVAGSILVPLLAREAYIRLGPCSELVAAVTKSLRYDDGDWYYDSDSEIRNDRASIRIDTLFGIKEIRATGVNRGVPTRLIRLNAPERRHVKRAYRAWKRATAPEREALVERMRRQVITKLRRA